jgi:hypothetical protein
MRRSLPCLFLLLFLAPALAADFSDPLPRYERGGGGFGCHTSKEDFARIQAEKRDVCLRIGPLYVGMARTDAEAMLGKPWTTVPVGARTAFAYLLQKDEARHLGTYTVLTYAADGRVDSVQVTGDPWPGNWQFSGLTLGTAQYKVTERLGAPLQSARSEDPGAVEWSYRPATFSFEIKAGLVSSIRLAAQ